MGIYYITKKKKLLITLMSASITNKWVIKISYYNNNKNCKAKLKKKLSFWDNLEQLKMWYY